MSSLWLESTFQHLPPPFITTLPDIVVGGLRFYRDSIFLFFGSVDNYKGSPPTSCQNVNGLKLDLHFYPPSINSTFYFIARLRTNNSTKHCQTVDSNNLPKNWGRPSLQNRGPKKTYICSVLRRLRDLMANIFRTKQDIDNWARAWKVQGIPCIFPKFRELWSTNVLKLDRNFSDS